MASNFDRLRFEQLAGPFNEWPKLLCPHCRQTTLEENVQEFESLSSLANREADDWEPTWVDGFFHGELQCPRTPCDNRYVVAGTWVVDWGPTGMTGSEDDPYLKGYSVRHILPEIPLMELPENIPGDLRSMTSSASAVLLSDPSAAANRIRSAIDCLLDNKGVRKFSSGGKRTRLTTHARIEEFRKKNAAAGEQLMAMKWIGNVGSHEGDALPLSWVLDGIEHFARAVEIVYDPRERELARRAAIINKKGKRLKATDATLVR